MKKLSLLVISLLMSVCAVAQITAGEYYLRNVETGMFLNEGWEWGTHAVVKNYPCLFQLEATDGGYLLKSPYGYIKEYAAWMDGNLDSTAPVVIEKSGEAYFIKMTDRYLSVGAPETYLGYIPIYVVDYTDEAQGNNSLWEFVPQAEMVASLKGATVDKPMNASFFIKGGEIQWDGADLVKSSWTYIKNGKKSQIEIIQSGGSNNINDKYERGVYAWCQDDGSYDGVDTVYQQISGMPAGHYKVTYRVLNQNKTPLVLKFNDAEGEPYQYDGMRDENGNMSNWYPDVWYSLIQNEEVCYFTVGADGKLSIRMEKEVKKGQSNRFAFKSFELAYLGSEPNGSPVKVTPGEYYLRNAETGLFLNEGWEWGTHAVAKGYPCLFKIEEAKDSGYYLKSPYGYIKEYAAWMDGDSTSTGPVTFEKLGDAYAINITGRYLSAVSEELYLNHIPLYVVNYTDELRGNSSAWELVTFDEMVASLKNATVANPVDASFFLKGGETQVDGAALVKSSWTYIKNGKKSEIEIMKSGGNNNVNDMMERGVFAWCANSYSVGGTDSVYQEITGLPAGHYIASYRVVNQNNSPLVVKFNGSTGNPSQYNGMLDQSGNMSSWYPDLWNTLISNIESCEFTVGDDGKLMVLMAKTMNKGQSSNFAFKTFILNYLGSEKAGESAKIAPGTYYLRNVGTGMFLNEGWEWGTHAVTKAYPCPIQIEVAENGGYYLKSPYGYIKEYAAWMDGKLEHTDPVKLEIYGDAYAIKMTNRYLTAGSEELYLDYIPLHVVDYTALADGNNSAWEFLSYDDMVASLSAATPLSPVNASFFIKGGEVQWSGNDYVKSGWNYIRDGVPAELDIVQAGGNSNINDKMERGLFVWCQDNGSADGVNIVYQNIQGMPIGSYMATYQIVNQNNTPLTVSFNGTNGGVYQYNGMLDNSGNMSSWYPDVWYSLLQNPQTCYFTVGSDGRLNISMEKTVRKGKTARFAFRTFSLYYLGFDPTGIDEVDADENGQVEYFNLQGIRVTNPSNGIYIRRQGNKVSKVMIK
ncbi:MAG: hypothetical protein HDR92_08465 [Bacteroides sp.]|nr:hypothetical protein [Bacteroides sp.]